MFSRFLLSLLTLVVSFSAPLHGLTQGYVDPSAYAPAIAALTSTGVIDGGGNVRLDDPVNRAEALKIILLSQAGSTELVERVRRSMPPISLFPDVSQNAWFAPYVEVGFAKGLIRGYPDGRLWPQGGVKVVEAIAMLTRAYGEQTALSPFRTSRDLPNQDGQWYSGAVSVAIARNAIMQGSQMSAGDFMTRGQLFDIVYRFREAHASSAGAYIENGSIPVQVSVTNSEVSENTPTFLSSISAHEVQFASKKDFAITIPSLGIVDLSVTHPSDPYNQKGVLEPLQTGVGHLFSYPGSDGKVMIYGHSSGYPWDLSKFTKIFRTINKMNIGERVYVTYQGNLYVYEVSEKKTILAKDTSRFENDANGEELILYTCWPLDSITHRYLVIAKPVETIPLR